MKIIAITTPLPKTKGAKVQDYNFLYEVYTTERMQEWLKLGNQTHTLEAATAFGHYAGGLSTTD
jgi:hypothetical protein